MVLNGNEKILICDFRRIGDGIMALPMSEAIKRRYPKSEITFLCENIAEGIADNNPYIENVVYFNKNRNFDNFKLLVHLRSKRFDVAIDSLGMPKTAFFAWASGAKNVIGMHHKRAFFYDKLYQEDFNYHYSAHHKLNVLKLIDAFPKENPPIPFINILDIEQKSMLEKLSKYNLREKDFFTSSPGSKLEDTLWNPKNWAKIYDWMIEKYNLPIVLQYAPSEKEFVEKILEQVKNRDKIVFGLEFKKIRDVVTMLSLSKFHLTQNNGSKHLANCVKTATLTLWGFESTYSNWKVPSDEVVDIIIWAQNFKGLEKEYSSATEPINIDVVMRNIEKIIDGKN